MITRLNIHLPALPPTDYPIIVGTHFYENIDEWFPPSFKQFTIVIITDSQVKKRYALPLLNAFLSYSTYPALLIDFPAGESSKQINTKQLIENKMMKYGCKKDTVMIALGGGVVGDMAGFIASTYMRGIPLIQIPTTLLAMVDSSIGGKTAINTPYGKNLMGTFWHPTVVVMDTHFLYSLPLIHVYSGLIEAVKLFMVSHRGHFLQFVDAIASMAITDPEPAFLKQIILFAIQGKAKIVEIDQKEKTGERMILNFGHTLGHAIEQVLDYTIPHGLAVGLGILVEMTISSQLGILKKDKAYAKAYNTLEILTRSVHTLFKTLNPHDLIAATELDKKNKDQTVRYVLLSKIGEVHQAKGEFAHPVDPACVEQALAQVQATLDLFPHSLL